jgi:hypothetical protein
LFVLIGLSIAVVSAVCWHSVEEIHYLKLFFPAQFTVQEAFYASALELIKVLIISLPFFLLVAVAVWLLRYLANGSSADRRDE